MFAGVSFFFSFFSFLSFLVELSSSTTSFFFFGLYPGGPEKRILT